MAHAGVYARNRRDLNQDCDVLPKKDRALTVPQVADRLNCSKGQIYKLINEGIIKALRVGERNGIRVYESEIDRFIDDRNDSFTE